MLQTVFADTNISVLVMLTFLNGVLTFQISAVAELDNLGEGVAETSFIDAMLAVPAARRAMHENESWSALPESYHSANTESSRPANTEWAHTARWSWNLAAHSPHLVALFVAAAPSAYLGAPELHANNVVGNLYRRMMDVARAMVLMDEDSSYRSYRGLPNNGWELFNWFY